MNKQEAIQIILNSDDNKRSEASLKKVSTAKLIEQATPLAKSLRFKSRRQELLDLISIHPLNKAKEATLRRSYSLAMIEAKLLKLSEVK